MATTPNIGLTVTDETETSKTFKDFRRELAGTDPDSNMMLLDEALNEAQSNVVGLTNRLNRFYTFAQNEPTTQQTGEIWNQIL